MREARLRARRFRKNMTDAEQFLWRKLRHRQLLGYKFRRQHPIGPYVADFACLAPKIVVELDGGQHQEQAERDQKRTQFLEAQGFTVVRFWNDEVFKELEGVLEKLLTILQDKAAKSPPP